MSANELKPRKSWVQHEGVLSYIIDCYMGTEPTSPRNRKPRRVFLWEEGGIAYKGNAEAFLEHLAKKFNLNISPASACTIHDTLRAMGETVLPTKPDREKPKKDSPHAGKFRQPDPDKWAISRQMN